MEQAEAVLADFIGRLQVGFHRLYPEAAERFSLIYYEGRLRRRICPREKPLRHIAVVGPTQVGKSTLVNLLLGSEQAEVSPLAGFTRHPQGFTAQPLTENLLQSIACHLPSMHLLPAQSTTEANGYSLFSIKDVASCSNLDGLLVWDTPDFDSVRATGYRYSVPAVCALADIVCVVVSKEKYADQSVWDLVRLIAPACPSLLVVINKVPEEQAELLRQYVSTKFKEENIPFRALLTLPYLSSTPVSVEGVWAGPLYEAISGALSDQPSLPPAMAREMNNHWPAWLAGVQREIHSAEQWHAAVLEALEDFADHYRRDYLVNPDYSDTLQRAILQLLSLLEIPGLADSLGRLRHFLTWPARQVKGLWRARPGSEGRGNESAVIEEEYGRLLARLQGFAGQQAVTDRGSAWWDAVWHHLQGFEMPIGELIQDHQQAFQPEIDQAAQALYERLKSQPILLNALRAARLTADTAGVAIALKTGGIGINDLFLTPAMLSLVAVLTEGALGRYMFSVEQGLKEKQLRSLQYHLLVKLGERLSQLPREIPQERLFGIAKEEVQKAQAALVELDDA